MSKQIIPRAFLSRVRTTSFSLLVIAFVIAGLSASAWAWLAPASKAKSAALVVRAEVVTHPAPMQSISSQERVEAEIITLRPTGFEPTEVTRPTGKFFLSVENRSGLDEVNLRLDGEKGNRLHNMRMPREELDWNDLVDLRPGNYLLTEADHPDWVCRITITAR